MLEKFDILLEGESDFKALQEVINQIKELESKDDSLNISDLISDLTIRLEAYKYDKEHETNS